jgi:hypothetical protein
LSWWFSVGSIDSPGFSRIFANSRILAVFNKLDVTPLTMSDGGLVGRSRRYTNIKFYRIGSRNGLFSKVKSEKNNLHGANKFALSSDVSSSRVDNRLRLDLLPIWRRHQ